MEWTIWSQVYPHTFFDKLSCLYNFFYYYYCEHVTECFTCFCEITLRRSELIEQFFFLPKQHKVKVPLLPYSNFFFYRFNDRRSSNEYIFVHNSMLTGVKDFFLNKFTFFQQKQFSFELAKEQLFLRSLLQFSEHGIQIYPIAGRYMLLISRWAVLVR